MIGSLPAQVLRPPLLTVVALHKRGVWLAWSGVGEEDAATQRKVYLQLPVGPVGAPGMPDIRVSRFCPRNSPQPWTDRSNLPCVVS